MVEKALDIGSDHRAVKLVLNISSFKAKPKRKRTTKSSTFGWKPTGASDYHALLDKRIADIRRTVRLDQRGAQLDDEFKKVEALVKETATSGSKAECRVEDSRRLCEETAALIGHRQELIQDDCSEDVRREMSKLIQSSLKKDLRS